MYRGQGEDFRTRGTRRLGPRSSIYPTIFRQGNGGLLADQKIRVRRFEHLDEYSAQLEQKYKFGGRPRVRMFEEIRWAILQHYKKTPTPLVDVTESLLVAASFAYFHRQSNVGYLFAFGFPHRHGSISYHADDQLVLVRLASTCPPEARRAHYQQACFAGHFPLINYGSNGHNLANRLVAKFRLDFDNFWTDNFRPLPEAILYPPRDAIQKFVDSL
ncbi:MAG: FRG domain-containing protein [Rhodospirillales bacterium]|nr:FRG domain-containing protein [Rhodospirillales bacterium]